MAGKSISNVVVIDSQVLLFWMNCKFHPWSYLSEYTVQGQVVMVKRIANAELAAGSQGGSMAYELSIFLHQILPCFACFFVRAG